MGETVFDSSFQAWPSVPVPLNYWDLGGPSPAGQWMRLTFILPSLRPKLWLWQTVVNRSLCFCATVLWTSCLPWVSFACLHGLRVTVYLRKPPLHSIDHFKITTLLAWQRLIPACSPHLISHDVHCWFHIINRTTRSIDKNHCTAQTSKLCL